MRAARLLSSGDSFALHRFTATRRRREVIAPCGCESKAQRRGVPHVALRQMTVRASNRSCVTRASRFTAVLRQICSACCLASARLCRCQEPRISLVDASYATSGRIGATAVRSQALELDKRRAAALAKLHATARSQHAAAATLKKMQQRYKVAGAATAAAVAAIIIERWRKKRRGWRLEDKVTVVLCTSPVKSNPSTKLIQETYGSMCHYAPCLKACRMIICCDGYKTRERPKYRSGQVTEEGGKAYEEFLQRLKKLNLGEIARCSERQGFGFALRNALTRVRTPYVIVVQHDRNFVREAPIVDIVKCLEKNDAWLKYVLLPTTTVLNYPRYVQSKYQLRIAPQPTEFGFSLTPLLQWYDSTHVCSMRHYREFVYRGGLVARGGFVEDKLGQYQLKRIKERGLSAHAEFAQFVLDDGIEKPMVSHLDGHDSRVLDKVRFV